MKRFIIIAALLLCQTNSNAQAILEWVNGLEAFAVKSNSIAEDKHGNIFVTGTFGLKCDFDPGAGTYYLNSTNYDAFVAKYDSDGRIVWARNITGADTTSPTGWSITLDNNGNVFVKGDFYGTVDFDPGVGVYNITSLGYNDQFILKLDNNGIFQWVPRVD